MRRQGSTRTRVRVLGVPGNQDTHKSVSFCRFRCPMFELVGGGEGQLVIIRMYAKVEALVPPTPLGAA